MKLKLSVCIIAFFFTLHLFSQNGFQFYGKDTTKEQVKFKFVNNLIVIPLEVNGKSLSFILDTGVNKTILFSLPQNDSIGLNNTSKIQLQGLGIGEPVDALLSKNNRIRINNLISNNESIYVILEHEFDLSARMGTTIHGIIGYTLLKDLIANINYKNKKINFFNPKTFAYKKCRKCDEFPLNFYRNKPFIELEVQLDTVGNKKTRVKMLIDSGGSDALWLFEHSKENIVTPNRFFRDILGEGLSGTIYGNRSRIPEIKLGRHRIKNPTVSFLDSISTENVRTFVNRNGSLGSDILKRFKIWIDYPNKKITIRKNGSLNEGFNYNMSGLDIVYNGQQLVKESFREIAKNSYNIENNQNNTISFVENYKYIFKNSYKIKRVLENSPAHEAGLLKEDIILKINGLSAYNYKMTDIVNLFKSKSNRKIRLTVDRKGVELKFEFRLRKRI